MSKTSLCSGEEAFVGTTMDDDDPDDHSTIGVEEELQVEEGREHIIYFALGVGVFTEMVCYEVWCSGSSEWVLAIMK